MNIYNHTRTNLRLLPVGTLAPNFQFMFFKLLRNLQKNTNVLINWLWLASGFT